MTRELRADAKRNRMKVLEIAQTVFAEEGLDVPIDEIARRAGLGVGTVYRHFPTKQALFEAIVADRIERIADHARELATAADPGAAFYGFVARLIEEGEAKRDFVDALAKTGVTVGSASSVFKRRFRDALAALIERAQKAGALRTDVDVEDVLALVAGTFAAIDRHRGKARDRLVAIVCDGLRPR
jgi:AcrR family transcriptional regulator